MNFILNEKSLDGQFQDEEQFILSLGPIATSIRIIHEYTNIQIYKIKNLCDYKITKDKRLLELKQFGNTDELVRFKKILDDEIYDDPYWDDDPHHDIGEEFLFEGKDVTATSLAEAAVTGDALLSFKLDKFVDNILDIKTLHNTFKVSSIYTPKYLLELYDDIIGIDGKSMLMIRYKDTRIDCSLLEGKYGVSILEKDEIHELLLTFDKFVKHESWENIMLDDGLEYKKYSPASEKVNWFKGSKYSQKNIMKFRFSSVLRCYGYRKGEVFRVLRFERDHKISDNG